ETLRALHRSGPPLLLINVWDVAGARIVEELGYPALATSSAAIANALGYADGQQIRRDEMLAVVARIAAAVKVPVTADMEAGYGSTPEAMADTVRAMLAAGAVGLNLEDVENEKFVPLERQVAKIRALREAGAAAGVPLVINARTDVYLHPGCPESNDYDEAVRRTKAFRAAGADCVFVPGLVDLALIQRLLRHSPGPINILATPKAPPLRQLFDAGVRRISTGSGPYRAAMAMLRRIASTARQEDLAAMFADQLPYADLNQLMAPR
ncbi:MAG TPA: isocitrate lyase/phosphoenolpyruvate mutase family protein, partial [Terriglobales bacterium]|nr:isocitrate lyase/phosphoenolpyruvate mutase family protein [Terriglobales bacterium]